MNLCYYIADGIHRIRNTKVVEYLRHRSAPKLAVDRGTSDAHYWQWQVDSSPGYFVKCHDLMQRIRNANVVDVGCGLGGRTAYLATQGVRQIVGTDINHPEIRNARQLANQLKPDEQARLSFREVEESQAGECSDADYEAYDVALLIDAMEHVRDPHAMLNYMFQLLKPGGVCYFSTWGWYHYRASHVYSIVPIPFATALFTDRAILNAVRRIVDRSYYRPTIWDSDPPSLRWEGVDSLHDRPGEYLNKYTIAQFENAMRDSEFHSGVMRVAGFGFRRFPFLRALNGLTRVPYVRELYHSAIFGRLEKPLASAGGTRLRPSALMRRAG